MDAVSMKESVMEYNIATLAKKARVTVRTLRHYDQIGLLKPQIRLANGRRIYGDEQFLRLSEIVFFKKMGINLPKIKGIFTAKDCSQMAAAALIERKKALAKEVKRLQQYVVSIDTVLPQYKNCALSQKERLEKFRSLQNTLKEVEEIQIKEFGREAVEKAKEKVAALTEDQVEDFMARSMKLMKSIVKAVEQELDPASKEVQAIVKQYYDQMTEFNPVTEEIFLKLRDCILDQREYYEAYHPKLPEFLYEAFDVFSNEHFKKKKRGSK